MIALNNAQENYLIDLKQIFIKYHSRNSKKYQDSKLLKLITAIEVIERVNRIIVWRSFEYILLVLNYFIHIMIKCPIRNITIGVYQIKIERILDQTGIDYSVLGKKIITKKRLNFRQLVKIIGISGKYETIEKMLINKFVDYKWKDLSQQEIYHIALYYSGNTEFKNEFNYYNVLKNLYCHAESEMLEKC